MSVGQAPGGGPAFPPREQARLSALARYAALELPPGTALDRLTALAARLFGVPYVHLTLLDERRQRFHACHGRTFEERDREGTLCAQTILAPPGEVLVVPDLRRHPQWRGHPSVAGEPHLRFYAGAPLRTADGHALGSLCLLDPRPRPDLTAAERATLLDLAQLAMHEFDRQLAAAQLQDARQAQQQAEARLRAVVDHTTDAVYIKDRAGRYLLANPATGALLGRVPAELLGREDTEVFGAEDARRILAVDEAVLQSGQPLTYERQTLIGCEARTFLTTKFPFVLPDGQVHGVIGMSRDITQRVRLEQALREANSDLEGRVSERTRDLERLAYQDALTGLGNRRACDGDLEALLAQLGEGGAAHLLLLDVNDFKVWNDEHGYARGDALLRGLARALEQSFRPQDWIYRYGGDEFVVVVHGDQPSHQLLLDRVAQAEELLRARGFADLSVSAGVASYPAEAQAPGELLRLADQRMLREKAARRATRRLDTLSGVVLDDRTVQRAGEVALRALRFTLALLARDDDTGDEAWAALIEAAVAAVPGAEGGTLYLREGEEFVIRAQKGFSDDLLGLSQSAAASLAWYGEAGGWQSGRARVIAGPEIDERSQAVNAADNRPRNRETYQAHGEIAQLRASLCVPVVQGERVVAQLNLDNLSDERAFGPEAVAVAEAFATQVAALLAAQVRQAREAARRRELEGLVAVNAALRTVRTPAEVREVLARQTARLLGTEHVVLMRYDPDADVLRPVVPGGLYVRFPPGGLPRGTGLAWAALESGEVVRAQDAHTDPRVYRPSTEQLGAVMAAPLRDAQGQALGALVVSRENAGTFSDLDAQLLGAIASAGVTAIERARAARAETERAEEFRMLAELSALVSALDHPHAVAERCLGICRQFLGADFAAMNTPAWGLDVQVGEAPGEFHAAARRRLREVEGMLGSLSRASSFVATHDYPAQPYAAPDLVAAGVRAAVFAPVLQDGRAVGLVSLVWFQPLAALPRAAAALTTRAAELIGQALERRTHLQEVEATREGALLALGLALELRDFETAGHTERVVALSAQLGQAVGMTGTELEGLRQGAYLHDIGKLAVPDRILLKPGKLDPQEWEVMQGHAAVGFDLTRSVPTLHPLAREVVRWHHERWDGAGYPDRLAGQAIPLAARVFSVVDVYDALTSERPYKPAWSPEAALNEIAAQAGRQFDPEVVRVFAKVLRRTWAEAGGQADPEAQGSAPTRKF